MLFFMFGGLRNVFDLSVLRIMPYTRRPLSSIGDLFDEITGEKVTRDYTSSKHGRFSAPQTRYSAPLGRFSSPFNEPDKPKLIWEGYRRNYKGSIPPQKTRLRCKRNAGRKRICSNPCPLCKNDADIQYTNVKLLEQFICPHTGNILPANKTGVCRLEQKKLVAAIEKAWDYGLMPFTILDKVILPDTFQTHEKPVMPTFNKVEVLVKPNTSINK